MPRTNKDSLNHQQVAPNSKSEPEGGTSDGSIDGDLGVGRLGVRSQTMENFRLKVFRTVAHHLNFRRASEDLFISQPAVTQQIKALEDEVGLPLFDRAGGRVVLTAVGKILLRLCQ